MAHKYTKVSKFLLLFFIAISLSGCFGFSKKEKMYKNLSKEDPRNTKYTGHYKIGKQYKIKGKKYNPQNVTRYSNTGTASWYGTRHGFHGSKTANGDTYNKNLLTAAHRTLPMPSLVKVTNLNNKKSLILMVNDRGPFSHNREIDVSEKAADLLGFKQAGITKVKVEYLHLETKDFLKKLGLKKKEGYIAKSKLDNEKCSVNCHIKLVNLKHKKKVNI